MQKILHIMGQKTQPTLHKMQQHQPNPTPNTNIQNKPNMKKLIKEQKYQLLMEFIQWNKCRTIQECAPHEIEYFIINKMPIDIDENTARQFFAERNEEYNITQKQKPQENNTEKT